MLNLPLTGAPTDRRERLLRAFIKDRKRLLRFLFFLLADDSELADAWARRFTGWAARVGGDVSRIERRPARVAAPDAPPFTAIVSTPSRVLSPTCENSPTIDGLLPPNFDDVWEPIWAVRQGRSEVKPLVRPGPSLASSRG